MNPKYVDAYRWRASAYLFTALLTAEDYDKAISDYTKAIKLDPKNVDAYHARALVYRRLGKNAQARADYDKARELGYTGPE